MSWCGLWDFVASTKIRAWWNTFFVSAGKNVFMFTLRVLIQQTFSSRPWSSQFWTQFKQLRTEAWKSRDFNAVWTRDLAIPVQRSNQLSYKATDVGSWSFVSSNEPVKNGCEVIYEMFHIPVRCSNQMSYEPTDVGSWSFVSSNEPVKNGCEVIYEMFHILNCGFEIK